MSATLQIPQDEKDAPIGGTLDPAILRVIEALARANARRDYAAAQRAAGRQETD